jgi:acetyl-CoA acetyltransferase
MREVVVLGVGLHKFGRYPDKTIQQMGRVAMLEAMNDAGVQFTNIQEVYCGRVYPGMGAGQDVVYEVGQTGIPINNIEQACSSSSNALRLAYLNIAAGYIDMALVVGFEKLPKGMLKDTAQPDSYDILMGLTSPMPWYALDARRHMDKYGTTVEQLAMVAVKSHKNGMLNPYAHYQRAMTVEEVLRSRLISDPITLYMCCPTSDGASSVILCSHDVARQYGLSRAITIAGWGAGTPRYRRGYPYDELHSELIPRASKMAYEKAGIGPEDVRVVQIHEAASIAEITAAEELGLCPEGMGGPWLERGVFDIGGKTPINTDGGLISRGHPLGATGLAQVIEVVTQLRGEGGARQVPNNPKVGLCQNSGIGGCIVFVLKK